MAKCKYCGEDGKNWYKDPDTGRFSLLDSDGSRHLCQSFNKEKTTYADFKPQYPTQQVQQPQQQQVPQGTPQDSGLTHGIKALSDQIAYHGEQITKLSELYSDIMNNLIEIAHSAKDASINSRKVLLIADKSDQFFDEAKLIHAKVDRLLASYTHSGSVSKDQEMADAEVQYDQDKEDGMI